MSTLQHAWARGVAVGLAVALPVAAALGQSSAPSGPAPAPGPAPRSPSAIGTPAPQVGPVAPLSPPPATAPGSTSNQTPPPSGTPGSSSAAPPPDATLPSGGGSSRTGRDAESASSLPGGGGKTLQDCMRFWDKGTHMSKQEWRAACRRTLNRLDALKAEAYEAQG